MKFATSHRAALVLPVSAAALWALGGAFAIPGFDRGIGPSAMASSRVVISIALLLVFIGIKDRGLLRVSRKALPAIVSYGLAMAAVNYTYYLSIDRIPLGVTLALQFTAPVMVLLYTTVVRRTRHPAQVWFAAALTLVGAIITGGAFSPGALDGFGVFIALVSAVCLCAIFLTSESIGRYDVNPVTTVFYGFVVAAIAWAIIDPWWNWPFDVLDDPVAVWSVLGVAILGTLVPFFINAVAARLLSASVIGIAMTTEPAFGGIFAWAILDQHLTASQIAGGALITLGVVLVERATKKTYVEEPTATPEPVRLAGQA